MKLVKGLLKFVFIGVVLAVGVLLIAVSRDQEQTTMKGSELFDAATTALQAGDVQSAYMLYVQSAYALLDPKAKALAFYDAANVGWMGKLADFETLVELYKQSLRYHPGFYEAGFNLEYLYWLKLKQPGNLPQPKAGESEQNQSKPGSKPGQGGGPRSGDI